MVPGFFAVLFLFDIVSSVSVESERSCLLNDIRVQKDFEISKFVGTWHVQSKTSRIWGPGTFDGGTYNMKFGSVGEVEMHFVGFREGSQCGAPDVSSLSQQASQGSYLVEFANSLTGIFRVVYTDYKLAVVVFCFNNHRTLRCEENQIQVEILSRQLDISDRELDHLLALIPSPCVTKEEFTVSITGQCEVPAVSKDDCEINDILADEDFAVRNLNGLWYEIARTRFTFNKLESGIHYYHCDNITTHCFGYYTGTSNGTCQKILKGVSKRKPGAPNGNLLGRLVTNTVWKDFKVLYNDGNYSLVYACYGDSSSVRCDPKLQEVVLKGREPTIDPALKEELAQKLKLVCLKPSDLKDTIFEENCTKQLLQHSRDERCNIENYHFQAQYDLEKKMGLWHLVAEVDTSRKLEEHIVNLEPVGSVQETVRTTKNNASSTIVIRYLLTHVCGSNGTGDLLLHLLNKSDSHYINTKPIYSDEQNSIFYKCKAPENHFCAPHNVQLKVYSRRPKLLPNIRQFLDSVIHKFCLNPDNLHVIDHFASVKENIQPTKLQQSECAVENIPAVDNFQQKRILGFWNEIARLPSPMPLSSGVIYYKEDENGYLNGVYSGYNNGKCLDPMIGLTKPRCPGNFDGNYLGKLQHPYGTSWSPWKILYTDYDNVTVAYACHLINHDGSCSSKGTKLHILSRTLSITKENRQIAYDVVKRACIHLQLEEDTFTGDCRASIKHAIGQFHDDEENEMSNKVSPGAAADDSNTDQQVDAESQQAETDPGKKI